MQIRICNEADGRGQKTPFVCKGSGTGQAIILGVLIKIACSEITRFVLSNAI